MRPSTPRIPSAAWALLICLQFANSNAWSAAPDVAAAAPTSPAGTPSPQPPLAPDSPLLPWEREAIDFDRHSDAWNQRWFPEFLENEEAANVLRTAALLLRCGEVGLHDAPNLVPEFREAIQAVAQRRRALVAGYDGPDLERIKHRGALQVHNDLSESEILLLRSALGGPSAQRIRSWASVLGVMDDFPSHARSTDGRFDPVRILRLKGYLQAELVWPDILRAMTAEDAEVTQRFLALKPLNQYNLSDKEDLRDLGDQVSSILPSVTERMMKDLPGWERAAASKLMEVQVGAEQRADPSLSPSVALNSPLKPLAEKLMNTSPVHIAGDVVRQICPSRPN